MVQIRMLIATGFLVSFGGFSVQSLAGTELKLRVGTFDPTKISESDVKLMSADERASTNYYIVQFKDKIHRGTQKKLADFGAKILRYLPDDAYIVRLEDFSQSLELTEWAEVNAVLPYMSGFRVSPEVESRHVFNRNHRTEVLVKFFPNVSWETADAQIANLKTATVLIADQNYAVFSVENGELDKLAAIEGVEWVQPKPDPQLMMVKLAGDLDNSPELQAPSMNVALTGFETGTKIMNFQAAWDRGFTGSSQVVAAADTGLDTGVEATIFSDFKTNFGGGAPFGIYMRSWEDPMGHGTHVAGSISASGEGSNGNFKGGAFGAKVYMQGMWSRMMNNLTVPTQLSRLFDGAKAQGAFLHSNSWGSPQNPGVYDGMAAQVDEYAFNNPEFLPIFAAGNEGVDVKGRPGTTAGSQVGDGRMDPGSISSPGTAKNALTVGASKNFLMQGGIQRPLGDLLEGKPWGVEPLKSSKLSDNANGLAPFSSRGPTVDGRIKPDLVAPGTNIVSNCSHISGASKLWGSLNADYCYSGGTSMSTPLTAGAAALVREYLARDWNANRPSAALVKGILMNTAFDMYPGQFGEVGVARGQELAARGPNGDQGYGRVDVDLATAPRGQVILAIKDDTVGIATGGEASFELQVSEGQNLKVTLIYTDAAGTPAAAKALVNDLDLWITNGSGVVSKSESRVNNHEHIVTPSVSGQLKVTIKGVSVPKGRNGNQPYAVIVSRTPS